MLYAFAVIGIVVTLKWLYENYLQAPLFLLRKRFGFARNVEY